MNLNLLNWNIRGLNSHKKQQILHDLLIKEHIDIVMIQESKKDNFSNRCLRKLSNRIDIWHWVPSRGRSGGILFGGDSNKIKLLSWEAHRFCLDIHFENKLDSTLWHLTTVYGPVDRTIKPQLWEELDTIRNNCTDMWVLCGDFNAIRNRKEKSGQQFDLRSSRMFNNFVGRHDLLEHKLPNRRFTWSNGLKFALLDRVFTTLDWDIQYPSSSLHYILTFFYLKVVSFADKTWAFS